MPAMVGPPGLAACVLMVVNRSPKGTARNSTLTSGFSALNAGCDRLELRDLVRSPVGQV